MPDPQTPSRLQIFKLPPDLEDQKQMEEQSDHVENGEVD
ncbi:hypothetical protein BofuT4_uP035330.1 [Botrytis cinerea T4]|uniref:Uncharacterized protein n=1 Tax=Botryotinia fuckeliana (strain T4) TaxID=999810 RepID=G2Y6I8_BOTF4|nr:hypothetical protein BofuT4_uP035330.1 [Botrytis cinerea T4]